MPRTSILKISMKRSFAPYLALRASADRLFDQIDCSQKENVVVDFAKTESMTRSFAHQYMLRKSRSAKNVSEANVPKAIKAIMVRSNEPVKIMAVSSRAIKPMKLLF